MNLKTRAPDANPYAAGAPDASSLRNTGLDPIGKTPWGTHLCQFYEDKQDLVEVLVPYFKAGLESNEFCMWVTSEPLHVAEATAALGAAVNDLDARLHDGQIEILDYREWYVPGGRFDSDRVLAKWVEKLQAARARGFEGLRLTGNTFWLEEADWQSFTDYEAAIDCIIGRYRMLAVCTYSLRKCGAVEIMDVVSNHAFALIKRRGAWQIIRSAERKRTEERLFESEERFRAIASNTPDHLLVQDRELRYRLVVNPPPGFTAEEMIGKTDHELFPAKEAEMLAGITRQVLETDQPTQVEIPLLSKNGEEQILSGTYVAKRNVHGAIDGVIGYFRNITEQKRAETALRLAYGRLRTLFDRRIGGIGITIGNAQGDVIEANDYYLDLLGRTRQELLTGQVRWVDSTPPEWLPADTRAFAQLRERGVCDPYEKEYLRGDGSRVPVLLVKAMMPGDSGEVLGFALDISERKRMEQTLLDANRRKDEFLATLGHELRNPLAPIRIAVHLLLSRATEDSAIRRPCEIIARQVHHLVRLVDDLLDVSRIERGKIELRRERVDVGHAAAQAVETCRPLADERGHRVTLAPPASPLHVAGDPTRLEQIIGNLVNNACKYTGTGGRIDITVAREKGDAVVRVKDNGIGLAAEDLARIFEPFYQAQPAPGQSLGGLGIGLTLVKRLAALHGGSIAATSEGPGKGSEFILRLPAADPFQASAPTAGTSSDTTPAAGRRVLLIDDNPEVREGTEMLLACGGHRVALAADGETGLAKALAEHPEVAVIDLGLPGMNGLEVARKMRAALGSDIFLIALTGYGQEGDRARTLAAGFDLHLVKPVEPQELLRLIAEGPREGRAHGA